MPFTEEQLAALEQSLASGAKEVRFQDRATVMFGADELLRLRNIIKNDLAAVDAPSGRVPRRRIILMASRSGSDGTRGGSL